MKLLTDHGKIADELTARFRDAARILGLLVWREALDQQQHVRFAIARTIVNRKAFFPAHGFAATCFDNVLTLPPFQPGHEAFGRFPDDSDVDFQQCVLAGRSALGLIHGDITEGAAFYQRAASTMPNECGPVVATVSLGDFHFYRIAYMTQPFYYKADTK